MTFVDGHGFAPEEMDVILRKSAACLALAGEKQSAAHRRDLTDIMLHKAGYEDRLTEIRNYYASEYDFKKGAGCPDNLLNICNVIDLGRASAALANIRLLGFCYKDPSGARFDAETLRSVHSYLYKDVYYDAGLYRAHNIDRFMDYADHRDLNNKINGFCQAFRRDFLDRDFKDMSEAGDFLAMSWGRLAAIRPFPDGNDFFELLFLDAACRYKRLEIDIRDRSLGELKLARDAAARGYIDLLGRILGQSLVEYASPKAEILNGSVMTDGVNKKEEM